MTAIAIIGQSMAGGVVLLSNAAPCKVTVGGKEVALSGCTVTSHGTHILPTVTASLQSKVTVGGIPVVLEGDIASCLHPVTGGSSTVSIG